MRRPLALLAVMSAAALPAAAQKMDQAAMMRWGNAKAIYYKVEGVHAGETSLTPTMGGLADITDRASFNLEWNLPEMKLVKVSDLKNTPAEATKLRDREPKCSPPVMKGP